MTVSTEIIATLEVAAPQNVGAEDAAEIRRAISVGEVDAFVVGESEDRQRVLMLSDAHTRYKQLVEDMEQGAVTVSGAGDILFANHSFATMLGWPLIDLAQSKLESHVAAPHRDRLERLLKPRPGERDIELTLTGRDGATVNVRISVVSSSDNFVTLLITDLSHQQALQDAQAIVTAIDKGRVDAFVIEGSEVVMLDSGQLPYRALVEHMHQGAVAVSQGRIAYANERFAAMVGLQDVSLVGRPLMALVAEADQHAVASLLAGTEVAHAELRLRGRSGGLSTLATMTRLDGHCLILFSDLTLQKRHQASDGRTRAFLGLLAGEFKAILQPVTESIGVLRQAHCEDDANRRALEVIDRQCARLAALAEDLARINPTE